MTSTGVDDRYRLLAAIGFVVAAIGSTLAAVATPGGSRPVPPGAVALAVAAAVTWWVHRRWVTLAAAVIAVVALLNVADDDDGAGALLGDAGVAAALGKWLLLVGAVTTLSALGVRLGIQRRHGRRRTAARSIAEAPADRWKTRLQIAALLVLAPVCAEYLAAYDDSTGDPVRLVGGLLVFSWLYGAPALLIREVARRVGLGWPGMLILGAVFGLTQAGLVDQSLFSLDYRDIESWDDDLRGTFIQPLGLSAYNVVNFIGGHVIYSICAPIALVEALRPSRHRDPWLSKWTMGVVALLYVAASGLVLGDHLANESSHASVSQLAGSAVLIAALVAAAFVLGRRRASLLDRDTATAPIVFVVALGVAAVYAMAPPTWLGVTVSVSAVALGGDFVRRSAQSRGWSLQHVVAVAAAFVLVRAALSFTYFPLLGNVSAARKYGHSTVLLLLMLVVCGSAWRATCQRTDISLEPRPAPTAQ